MLEFAGRGKYKTHWLMDSSEFRLSDRTTSAIAKAE